MRLSRMRFLSRRAMWCLFMIACLAVVLLATATVVKTGEPPVFAVTNARIIPVAGAPIEKGTIVLRRGIIESVGANVAVPADARVIDATGLTVYPGFIDAFSDIGLEEQARQTTPAAATPPVTGRGAQQQPQQPAIPPDERQGLTPYRQALEVLNPANSKVAAARAAGVTTTMVTPRRGFFPVKARWSTSPALKSERWWSRPPLPSTSTLPAEAVPVGAEAATRVRLWVSSLS